MALVVMIEVVEDEEEKQMQCHKVDEIESNAWTGMPVSESRLRIGFAVFTRLGNGQDNSKKKNRRIN